MFLSVLVALAAATMFAGCHKGPNIIDRVQPNAIKKAMLDGEWYFQTKVVDVPGGMTHGFMVPAVVGWSTDPERIAFDIQEHFLYIRRATELIDGSQSYSQDWDDELDSHAILAAYTIESHFDIIQDYNPVTGEKFNVIVENTTDRPWWDREFIRVDWSVNLAPNYELGEGLELVDQEPIAFYVQDECTPQDETAISVEDRCIPDDNAPFFDLKWNEEGSALERGYFDITNAFIATPRMVDAEGLGEIPACWLIGNDTDECVATTYHTRMSFWKLTENERDYEPMPYSGEISSQFGFFSDDRLVFDEKEGINEHTREYYLRRHNIWEQTHSVADAEGIDWSASDAALFNPVNSRLCHTTADCCVEFDPADPTSEAGCPSVCDLQADLRPVDRTEFELRNACKFVVPPQDLVTKCEPTFYCTVPYNKRRVRPMVFYVNEEWPEELVRHPNEPKFMPPGEEYPGAWSYETDHTPDSASLNAFAYANADESDLDDRPMMKQISDRWNAPFVRLINILKHKAAGSYNEEVYANTPYVNDDMHREQGGTGDFYGVGLLDKDSNGMPTGGLGFDEYWYDMERPPLTICRFNPVLGPDNDLHNVEPDICWERIQEMSHCVFKPERPGVNPKTGTFWTEAAEWPLCSMREASPRIGDIRHSFVWWVDKWFDGLKIIGMGPSSSDPITGEILSGTAHIYLHNNEISSRIVDRTMLLTGYLDSNEYIDGYDLIGWRNQYTGSDTNPYAMTKSTHSSAGMLASMGSLMRVNTSLGDKFGLSYDAALGTMAFEPGDGTSKPKPSPVELMKDDLLTAAEAAYSAGSIHADGQMIESIATADGGKYLEGALLSEANAMTLLVGSGMSPMTSWQSDEIKDYLLVTRKDPFALARYRRDLMNRISEFKAGDFAIHGDEAADSLAYEVQRLVAKGKLPSDGGSGFKNALWRMTRKKIVRSATMHEIGHTVGLRHNFAGSQDYLNYLEPYWEIREHGCSDVEYGDQWAPPIDEPGSDNPWGAHEADGCSNPDPTLGPRFLDWGDEDGDPLSKYEVYKKLNHFAYSSVMDYSASSHLDEMSLGRYDWAAALFGYGHHFEVYKDYPKTWQGADDLTNEPRSWQFHKAMRPGFATADCPDTCTIVDDEAGFTTAGIEIGARVINSITAQEATVASVLADRITLEPGSCFDAPVEKGQGYAVWAWPHGFVGPQMISASMTVKYMLDRYLRDMGVPVAIYTNYFIAPHYTEFYRNWVDNYTTEPNRGFNIQDNRGVRDVREFNWKVTSQNNFWAPGFDLLDMTDNVIRVPYAYCTDSRVDISNSCRRRDYGADDWERMNHMIADWDQWYISRSFVRGEVGELPEDYASSYYDQIYGVPKQYNDIYALWVELVSGLYSERALQSMMTDPFNSWGGYTMALHDGFNMLMQTLAAPDAIDGYSPGPRPENGLYSLNYDPLLSGTAGFDIGQGARVFQTLYSNYTGNGSDDNCGEPFWRCLWNIGYYYDKVMAINGLSDSATHFVGRDTAHDLRLFRISFFDNFNWQIKRDFASLMGEKWDRWAPVTPVRHSDNAFGSNKFPELYQGNPVHPNTGNPSPALFFRDWANPVWDITNPNIYASSPDLSTATKSDLDDPGDFYNTQWTPIDPVTGFTVQVYAMVLGMARFQHNYDQSFYNTSRMWFRSGDTIDTLGNYVSFYDSESNIIYTALAEYGVNEVFHPFTTEDLTEEGIAAAMIAFANKTKSRSSDCDPGDDPITIEDEEITPWIEDDCCDNPYDGIAQPYLVPCPEEYGNPSLMTPSELEEASQNLLEDRENVDVYLKKYKGLLDFQVRLTNVYDLYMGFVGGEYDPG